MGGGPDYAEMGGSRILNASRVDQGSNDDDDIANWDTANDLIVAVNINSGGKDTAAAQYKLRWKNTTDSGSFADLAASDGAQLHYDGTTDLVNGAGILEAGRKCDSQGGDSWQSGEEVEGASLSDSIDLADEYETELHFAVGMNFALAGKLYEFELYDSTNGASKGTCGANVTIAVSGPPIAAVMHHFLHR